MLHLSSNDRYFKNAQFAEPVFTACEIDISISAVLYRMHELHHGRGLHVAMQMQKKASRCIHSIECGNIFNA